MIEVIGVRFKKAGKIYYFDPGENQLTLDDHVIVETVRGIEYGKVVIANKKVDEEDVVLPLKKVIRVAQNKIIKLFKKITKRQKKLFKFVQRRFVNMS